MLSVFCFIILKLKRQFYIFQILVLCIPNQSISKILKQITKLPSLPSPPNLKITTL
jgi:hypothetical protein